MKYYLNQTLDIILTVSLDNEELILSQASVTQIHYRSARGAQGSWDAQVVGETLVYTAPFGTINEVGDWAVWSHVEFGEKVYTGTPSAIKVYTPGT